MNIQWIANVLAKLLITLSICWGTRHSVCNRYLPPLHAWQHRGETRVMQSRHIFCIDRKYVVENVHVHICVFVSLSMKIFYIHFNWCTRVCLTHVWCKGGVCECISVVPGNCTLTEKWHQHTLMEVVPTCVHSVHVNSSKAGHLRLH